MANWKVSIGELDSDRKIKGEWSIILMYEIYACRI